MKLIKRCQKCGIWLCVIVCLAIGVLTAKAAQDPDLSYAFKIESLDLTGVFLKSLQGTDLIKVDAFEIQPYDAVTITQGTANEKVLHVGKMKINVNTTERWQTVYIPAVSDIKYSSPTANSDKAVETLDALLRGKQQQIPLFGTDFKIAAWTDTEGIKYTTCYDLEIINSSDVDFCIDEQNGIAYASGYSSEYDDTTKVISLKSSTKLAPSEQSVNLYPVYRKDIQILNTKDNGEKVTIYDNYTTLSKLNFRKGNYTLHVLDGAGKISGEYTLQMDVPQKVTILPGILKKSYNITEIKYTNYSGQEVVVKTPLNQNPQIKSIEDIKSGTLVSVSVVPILSKDVGKILAEVPEQKNSPMKPDVTVLEGQNIFTFIMPNGWVTLPLTVTFKEAEAKTYGLNGEASKTNNGRISMGTVEFKNDSGETIYQAEAGTQVTVTASPAIRSEYEFAFDGWETDDLELTDDKKMNPSIQFTVPEKNVKLTAKFKKIGVKVTIKSSNYSLGQVASWYPDGSSYYQSSYSITKGDPFTDIVKANATISFNIDSLDVGYTCSSWKILKGTTDITDTITNYREVQKGYCKYQAPEITVTGDEEITVEAFFENRITRQVTVTSSDEDMGTAEVVGNAVNYKDDPVTIIATPKSNIYAFQEWKIISPDQETAAESQKITLRTIKAEGDDEKSITRAQFFMIGEPVEIQAVFYKAVLSSDNSITEIILKDQQQNQYITDNSGGNNYTVELSSDKTKAEVQQLLSGNFTLTLEIPEYATAAFGDDKNYYDKTAWETGISVSGFELNQAKSIKVKAENGDIREYTLKFTWTANGEKEISALELFDQEQSLGTGNLDQNGTDWIVTLSQDLTQKQVNDLFAKDLKLKLTIPSRATATFGDGSACGSADWNAGQTVRITGLNSQHVITVTAEDDTTATYNLIVKWTAKGDKELTAVTLQDSQKNDLGTGVASGTAWTVTLSQNLTQAEVDNLFKAGFYLKLTISDRAKAALEGAAGSTKEAWANGVKVGILKLNEAKKLTVTAEDGSTQKYTIKIAWSPKPTSKEKDLTDVKLLDKDKKVIAGGKLEGTAWTVEIPEDKYTKQQASNLAVGGSYLKLVASEGAKIEQKDGYSDNGAGLAPWSSGNITTNMTLNKPYTFTVIAENGSTKIYTITLSYPTEKPVLKAGTVTRSSDQEAKAVFSSTLAGKYYWAVVEQGEKEPNISTSYAGSTAKKGNNTVTLTSLEAGAKDLYIVVKSTDGEISDPLKIEIPAYDAAAKEYAITLSYPTSGGTLKASATKAKAGDKITITVTPKTGYKLTPGTLKYSESSSTGAVVNIDETTFTFTMPASEISISCTWTAESTDQPETTTGKIGAFVVNGVSGTVDNTTGMITVTLPNGTDLTSLAPVITISGAKSISPASGATVDLSSPVTYTLTLEDGTTKTYTVRAYVEGPSKSDQLWNDMLNNVDGSPDHSGSKTWWKKAKDLKKHNDYPEYW